MGALSWVQKDFFTALLALAREQNVAILTAQQRKRSKDRR